MVGEKSVTQRESPVGDGADLDLQSGGGYKDRCVTKRHWLCTQGTTSVNLLVLILHEMSLLGESG